MSNQNSPVKVHYFPRDSVFWAYHLTTLALLITTQIILAIVIGDAKRFLLFEVISFSIWVTSFTLAVLYFRYRYKIDQWGQFATPHLVRKSFIQTIILGLLIVLLMGFVSLPPFWQELYAEKIKTQPDLTVERYFLMLLLGNWASSSIFVMGWVFIYIGISNSRVAKQSEVDNLRLQNSLKAAQLNNLSNQLNPHFLFNSLNNIRFMIHENPQQADSVITSLSEVLRYSLESNGSDKVSLAKELQVIERYIDIVEIQYEDRLRFTRQIDPSAELALIPPMMLQMLIENSVKHGLEHLQEGGEIVLRAEIKDEQLSLTVENDIAGNLTHARADDDQSTGLGLSNIRQRLEILYSGAATLNSGISADRYVVSIELPLERVAR